MSFLTTRQEAGMGRTLSSALTLSTIGLGSKALVKFLTKRFEVRGLPILLDALKEPDLDLSWRKGKQRAVEGMDGESLPKRRGIVTGMFLSLATQNPC